jgi:hypothetical protein
LIAKGSNENLLSDMAASQASSFWNGADELACADEVGRASTTINGQKPETVIVSNGNCVSKAAYLVGASRFEVGQTSSQH